MCPKQKQIKNKDEMHIICLTTRTCTQCFAIILENNVDWYEKLCFYKCYVYVLNKKMFA